MSKKHLIPDNKKEVIIQKLMADIDAANAYYEESIEPNVMERYAIYKASKEFYKKMFPVLSERSELVSTDVQDTIESTMPSLMKTFFGGTDVISIRGKDSTAADDMCAQTMQDLIEYELDKNRFFSTAYKWFKDSLICNAGIVKVDWLRTTKRERKTESLSVDGYNQIMAQADTNKDIKIIKVDADPVHNGFYVTYECSVLDKNQPRIMNLMASELRYNADATSLETADFVAHRKIVTIDYLREQEEAGMYENVEELASKATDPSYTSLDEQNNDHIGDEPLSDTGRMKVELYECYVNINLTDNPNGRLTPAIITISNGVILRAEENTYERNPFFILSPRLDPHKIWPDSGFVDLIAPLQHTKTAMLRQMIYNISQCNDSRMGVDMTMLSEDGINDLLNNNRFIRVKGDVKQALQPLPTNPLQSWTFTMLQYLDDQRENRTGITRYNQGLDSAGLNKTATGVSIITQQSNQRLELIARMFAETGLMDMFRFLIKLNQLFISEDTVIRLVNQPMTIHPEDLDGDFDLVVNAGMGNGAQQDHLQKLSAIRDIVTQLAQVGLAGPQQAYNLAKKTIEELGYKDVDDFILNPQQLQQQQAQQPQQQQEQPEIEKLNLDDDTIPWQIKKQYFEKQGYQVEDSWFSENAIEGRLKHAIDKNMDSNGGHIDENENRNIPNRVGSGNKLERENPTRRNSEASVGIYEIPDQHNQAAAANQAGTPAVNRGGYGV